jgi:hypothetical protein
VGAGAGRLLRVSDEPLEIASAPFAPGPAARALIVAVRGDGRLVARAGGRAASARATGRWRDVRVPLAPDAPALTLTLTAGPGAGPLEVRDLGLVVRETRLTGLRVARRPRARVVLGRLVPAGGGLALEARAAGGARLAATTADRSGRFRLVVAVGARPPRALALVTAGDRTRLPGRWSVRIPGPAPSGRRGGAGG